MIIRRIDARFALSLPSFKIFCVFIVVWRISCIYYGICIGSGLVYDFSICCVFMFLVVETA